MSQVPGAAPFVLGAVAYDPKVVTIWEGFKAYFASQAFAFDYVLYSNYESQVEAHFAGSFDVAWNSPLAWVRAERLASARGEAVRAIAMRDTDCDLTSLIVVRAHSQIQAVGDLAGKTVGVGAIDSPQATLLPLSHLRHLGLVPERDFKVRRFDRLGGKHGDHIGGERDAARALAAGEIDAACMIDGNHLLFVNEGTLPTGTSRVVSQTAPYDHCNFTVREGQKVAGVERFYALLMAMRYDNPIVRPLFDLEGLKAWRSGRIEGYRDLQVAVDEAGFYDSVGNIRVAEYAY